MEHLENMEMNMEQYGEGAGQTEPDQAGDNLFAGQDENFETPGEGGEENGTQGVEQETAPEAEPEKPRRKTRRKKDEPDAADGADESALALEDQGPGEDGERPDEAADEGADLLEPGGPQPEGSGEGELDPEPGFDSSFEPEPDSPGEPEPAPAARRRRASASRRPAVLDSYGNVIYDRSDSGQHDLSILTAARNGRKILTATVDAIETDGEALPRVVFYVGTVKVMIPFNQMGFDLDPETITQREARLLIDSMLSAKIDYMVRGVDTQNRVAGASRRDAMILRQRTILNARGTGSEFRVNEGTRCMARVLHVSRNLVRVEVFGFETYVRIDNISNLWVNDIREVVRVGEERPVEITSLTRDENGRVTSMRVSMKAAEDAPQLELRTGNTYTGSISNFSATAYFVRVAGIPVEVRCPINSNYTMELMEQGDFVKFYVRAIYDGVPTGAILKIIKKKNAGM